jgi:hypothetical protein
MYTIKTTKLDIMYSIQMTIRCSMKPAITNLEKRSYTVALS